MANIKSALKRTQIARIRTAKNAAYKSMMKTAVRRFEAALKEADLENAKEKLQNAVRIMINLPVGIIHKNMAPVNPA